PPRVREVRLADGSTARLIDDDAGRRIEHGDRVFFLEREGGALVLRDGSGAVIASVREGEGGAVVVADATGAEQVVRPDELAAAGDTPASVAAWTIARAAH